MTVGHGRGIWVALLLLSSLWVPFASASGGGLLLSGDSFSIIGDQEVGAGDVNISVDVVAHDSNSNGFLEMTFTAEDNTPLASDNRSISLLADESITEVFDFTLVPIGTHNLSLKLWGDVGVGFENNMTQIQVFIQRLSPGNASIEYSGDWNVVPIDSDTGAASGNNTLRDGDHAWVIAIVENTGDVTWSGNATISNQSSVISIQALNISGLSTDSVNFTLGPLLEGTTTISIDLMDDQTSVASDSLILNIGPPPLPRPLLLMAPESTNPNLGDSMNWTISTENSGESTFDGILYCSFPSGVAILNESISVTPGQNQTWIVIVDVRPGQLDCAVTSSQRLHIDSITSTSHVYDMSAGHLMRAGSDGLTVTGGPFHVGDPIPLAILIHNGGDFSGVASLEVREGDPDGNNMGSWNSLETRTLEVGSSLELGSQHIPIVSGERQIEWRIVSSDSLVSNDLSGIISLIVQPSQSLDVSISSLGWTLSDGLEVEVTTALSPGESRSVLLDVGTSGSSGDESQISVEILLSPGQRTLTYNLGHPTSSSLAKVELTPIGWVSTSIADDEITLVRPNPQISVTLNSVSPSNPVQGESATISYSLVNAGGGDTLAGELMLIDLKHEGEVLWTGPAPVVASGENNSASFSLEQWPSGSVVDLRLIWHTSTTDVTGTNSFLSESAQTTEQGFTIDWLSLIYGSLAGLFIGLVTRTVMRARAGKPLLPRRERGSRATKPKKSVAKTVDEKVEVACPACDQKLRVPSTYSGTARCPACAQTFPVEAAEEEV
ncbi:MAG: hypothetical protein VYB17_00145, partial [Candidatus Thermoplasmatota archaeon]|nr:hypothetical protein [Candidatus Thermoplasmatota archaeon]